MDHARLCSSASFDAEDRRRHGVVRNVAGRVADERIRLPAGMGVCRRLRRHRPANTGAAATLVGAQSNKSDYTLDKGCSRTKKSVRFTHRGLSLSGVTKAGYNQSPTVYCGVPRRVFVRYRIGFADSGKPATATVTVWAKRKTSSRLREIGYSQWSRSKSTTYYSRKACTSQQY